MGKRIVMGCLLGILIPYILTLAWTGSIRGQQEAPRVVSGKRILLERGGLMTYVDVEEYLPGVVAKQMPADYGEEALRAQAVIARTYIYKKMGTNDEIEESELKIDYFEERQLEELWGSDNFVKYYDKIEKAVQSTKCMVITFEGDYIDPLFHRACIGYTRKGDEYHPYLESVSSLQDVESDNYLTILTWSKESFAEKINSIPGASYITAEQVPGTIQLISKDEAGYVTQIQIGTKAYTGEEVRYALGLPSSGFTLEEYEGGLRAVCKGIGHGYGLSQYGAKMKASEGWAMEDILAYFYKNTEIITK